MAKGQEYERLLCKELSLWLTSGNRDDVLWRSAGSGARATVRGRKGKTTVGHHGDICATCAEGERLTRWVTVEAKKGYNSAALRDLFNPRLDEERSAAGSKRKAVTRLKGMVRQAYEAAAGAGTPHWLLVHKPSNFPGMVYADLKLFQAFWGSKTSRWPEPCGVARYETAAGRSVTVAYTLWHVFLDNADPKLVPE